MKYITKNCIICGKIFYRMLSDMGRTMKQGKFCSRKCYGIWKSKNIIGEKHPSWIGGKKFWKCNIEKSKEYSINWTATLKRSIRERDHYTCQICGALQSDIVFHVHHIDYDKKNCNPDNLITLCPLCHAKTNGNRKYWQNYLSLLVL